MSTTIDQQIEFGSTARGTCLQQGKQPSILIQIYLTGRQAGNSRTHKPLSSGMVAPARTGPTCGPNSKKHAHNLNAQFQIQRYTRGEDWQTPGAGLLLDKNALRRPCCWMRTPDIHRCLGLPDDLVHVVAEFVCCCWR